jgi:hypothetical protein
MRLFHMQHNGGRRELEKRLRAERTRADALQAALEALADGGNIPAELLAAASMAGPDGQAVKTCIDGRKVFVVIGDEGGSAPEWAAAIRQGLPGRMAS